MLYNEPFNFKPIPSITPVSAYWQNSTWKFNMSEITPNTSGPSWQDIVLSGNTALTLTNSLVNGLNYLKLFGGCEQSETPTPDAPVNIVCNNGAIKIKHQSGLPLGYTLLEYIEADGNQQLNTGVKIASTDVVYSEFANSSSSGYGALYGIYATGESSAFYANSTYYGYDETNQKINTNISVDTDWHTVIHDFVNGTLALDNIPTSFTPFEFENTVNNYLFCRYYNGSYGYGFKGKCRKHIVTRNFVNQCDLLPVMRESDNELGMYNLINNTFCPNIGTGTFVGGNPVLDPVIIYIDGTTETVEVDTTGDIATAEMLLGVGDYQDEQNVTNGHITRNVGIKVLDGTEDWMSNTVSSGRLVYYILKTSIGSNSTVLPAGSSNLFCTHYAVSTAQAQSQYDTIWSGGTAINFTSGNKNPTVTDWKQFLADQYANGTPVIIVYPLAEPTTETVTGQHLTTKSGTNTIEITQASISNLPLEVSYKGVI